MALLTEKEIKDLLTIFPNGVVALDLETTGLSPISDSIIEIAILKINPDGRFETYEELINPGHPIPPKTIAIHKITDDMVSDKPSAFDIIPKAMEFIGDFPIIAHNAQFDIGFIVKDMHRIGVDFSESKIFDSCQLARSVFKYQENQPDNFKLSSLAKHFSIPLNHHRALEDTTACLRIFAQCIPLIKGNNPYEFVEKRCYLFDFTSLNKLKDLEMDEKFDLLVESIPNQETVHIVYKGGATGDKPRPIRPIGIIPMPNGLILYAECLLNNIHKSFLLKKVKEVLKKEE
jgi:DNA polymerase-3 subunit epsilon